MRLWSLHPELLDAKGLVALWREGLLAQHVLLGRTRGYKNHPQLLRFKECKDPVQAISNYLREVHKEAVRRDYNFDISKIAKRTKPFEMKVTKGQRDFELKHLKKKLRIRDPEKFKALSAMTKIKLHPSFKLIPGGIEEWEIV